MSRRASPKTNFNDSFDVDAEGYHAVRPGYPDDMYEELHQVCSISRRSRLLEVGAGSGIATRELAKSGAQIVAVEPGQHLATIAKQETKHQPNVKVFVGTFEAYRDPKPFDAILAFTAFHWLNKTTKFQAVADRLKDAGHLVIAWNSYCQSETPVTAAVDRVYQECLPEEYSDVSSAAAVNQGVLAKLRARELEILSSPLFYPVRYKKYLVSATYDGRTYPRLLNTFPKIVALNDEKRSRFLERIAIVVNDHGSIVVPVLTTFIVCRKFNDYLKSLGQS